MCSPRISSPAASTSVMHRSLSVARDSIYEYYFLRKTRYRRYRLVENAAPCSLRADESSLLCRFSFSCLVFLYVDVLLCRYLLKLIFHIFFWFWISGFDFIPLSLLEKNTLIELLNTKCLLLCTRPSLDAKANATPLPHTPALTNLQQRPQNNCEQRVSAERGREARTRRPYSIWEQSSTVDTWNL